MPRLVCSESGRAISDLQSGRTCRSSSATEEHDHAGAREPGSNRAQADASELGDCAKCDHERALGKRATERMKELLHGRVVLDLTGVDEFGRLLAEVKLADGRDLGQVLIEEDGSALFGGTAAELVLAQLLREARRRSPMSALISGKRSSVLLIRACTHKRPPPHHLAVRNDIQMTARAPIDPHWTQSARLDVPISQ